MSCQDLQALGLYMQPFPNLGYMKDLRGVNRGASSRPVAKRLELESSNLSCHHGVPESASNIRGFFIDLLFKPRNSEGSFVFSEVI